MYLFRVLFPFLITGYCYGESCVRLQDCQQTTCTNHGLLTCFDNNCLCLVAADPCTANPCPTDYTCRAIGHNSRQCYCGTSTSCNNGHCTTHNTCHNEHACSSSPCHNAGTCHQTTHEPYYSCSCNIGWTGQNCTEHVCNSKPCHNDGTCHQTTHNPHYSCSCHFGWTGQNCTETHCESNPCRNGGNCVRLPDDPYYHCTCPYNYHGVQCEHQICGHNSCHNGGKCVPNSHTGHFTCQCPSGYSGGVCNIHVTTALPTTPASAPITTPQSTGTSHPPRIHITDVPHDPKYGPYCLTCDDVVSPNACEYVARSGPHEVCSVESFVTSAGVIRYNLGSKDSKQCPSTKRGSQSEDASTITVCSECCNDHLCNSGGCGVNGYTKMTWADRGPVCFHCDQENSPAECSKLAVCGRDEVCAVAHTKVATTQQTIWKSWCIHTSECVKDIQLYKNNTHVEEFTAVGKYAGLRVNGQCWLMCCVDDLCNRQCPDTPTALYTNLIG